MKHIGLDGHKQYDHAMTIDTETGEINRVYCIPAQSLFIRCSLGLQAARRYPWQRTHSLGMQQGGCRPSYRPSQYWGSQVSILVLPGLLRPATGLRPITGRGVAWLLLS